MKVIDAFFRAKPVFFAVWQQRGKFGKKLFRYPLEADAESRAAIRAEALRYAQSQDDRIHPDQTFAGYLHYYAEHLPEEMSEDAKGQVKPAIKLCAGLVRDVRLAGLRSDHIAALWLAVLKSNRQRPEGKGFAPRTLQNHFGAVQQALNYALEEGRIVANPFKAYFTEPGNRFKRPSHPLDPVVTEQYPEIEAKLDEHTLVYMRLHTEAGLSGPEAAALTWDKVDFGAGSINVHQTYRPRGGVGPCKPNRHRTVNGIDPAFMAYLAEVKARSPEYGTPYVVNALGIRGEPLGRTRALMRCSAALRNAQHAAGIKSLNTKKPYKAKSFRDRHTVDRLNNPKRNFQVTQDEAGSSCAVSFVRRFGPAYRPRDAGEQIARLVIGMERLRALGPH
jgi:hypothetical protein